MSLRLKSLSVAFGFSIAAWSVILHSITMLS